MKCQKNNGIIMDHFNKSSTPPKKSALYATCCIKKKPLRRSVCLDDNNRDKNPQRFSRF